LIIQIIKFNKGGYMDDDPHEHKRGNTSIGTIFQSPRLQRAVRSYNESHTVLLAYIIDFLFGIDSSVYNLFFSKDVGKKTNKK